MTSTLYFMFHSVVVNYLASGILLASVGRFIANNHLLSTSASSLPSGTTISPVSSGSSSVHIVRQEVEWMYAFDVHCNAFWLFFVIVYGVQFFLLPIVLGKGFGSFLVSNLLYSAGFFGYFYVTHLGYRALPFLSSTEVFLFPLAAVVFVFLLNFVGYPFGFGWNASRIMAHIYFESS